MPAQKVLANEVMVPLKVLFASDQYQENWIEQTEPENQILGQDSVQSGVALGSNYLVFQFQSNQIDLATITQVAYDKAYQASLKHGYPHLIRTWNYIHDINGSDDGLERYQSFCVARHAMLEKHNQLSTPNPAATAIGSHNGDNVFVFLFSKISGQVIENNRQVSAWEYPKQYAPKQPRFSRAMKQKDVLMCSGTASVVGHETKHLNDVTAQFDECLKNVSVLLSEEGGHFAVETGLYRFYIRHASHANLVKEKITGYGIKNFIVLHGDVCRENLLIECEVVFQ